MRQAERAEADRHQRVLDRAQELYGSDEVDVLDEVTEVEGGAWVTALVWVGDED